MDQVLDCWLNCKWSFCKILYKHSCDSITSLLLCQTTCQSQIPWKKKWELKWRINIMYQWWFSDTVNAHYQSSQSCVPLCLCNATPLCCLATFPIIQFCSSFLFYSLHKTLPSLCRDHFMNAISHARPRFTVISQQLLGFYALCRA